jgi:uncharacterized protein
MRLSRRLSSLLVFGLAAMLPLHAQTAAPASPYSVVVPVADTSETQRDQAFAEALGQVLARVAGGQDLRDAPGYADALKGAPGLVAQFQYQRAGSGLALQTNFDPGAVRRLVAQLGVPAAGVKPPVLLMVQGADGSLLGKDSLDALAQVAAARGYNVIYPDPSHTPDPAAVAAADPAALATITRQYKTGLILLGSLGKGSADWTLVSGGQPQHWVATGASEDAMLAAAGNSMIDRIGRQLNVIGAQVSEAQLWVANVNSALDYAGLLAAVRNDPSVREVATLGARDDGMLLRVKAALPAGALAASLAAGGHLIQAQPHAGADASLRWLH